MSSARHLSGKFRQGAPFVLCLAAGLLAETFLTSPTLNAATNDPLDLWFARPFAALHQLRTATYAGGKFFAGGSDEILTSADGANWSRHPLPTNGFVMGFAYDGNMYVAVTISGLVFTSPDAERWTVRPTPDYGELWSVGYGNGVFVAAGAHAVPGLGNRAATLTSSNGVDWTWQDINGPGSPLLSIVFGDGTFVATGAFGAIYT